MKSKHFLQRRTLLTASALMLTSLAGTAMAQTAEKTADKWPDKPVRIIVAGPVGANADVVARALGDPTASQLNRLSLNPLRHVDPIGTILVPGALKLMGLPVFGWAKPVPVDFSRLNNPRRDMILVAAAGPGMNLVMALIGALAPIIPMVVALGAGAGVAAAGIYELIQAMGENGKGYPKLRREIDETKESFKSWGKELAPAFAKAIASRI